MIKIIRQSLDNGYPTIKVYGDPLVKEGERVYEHRYVLMKKLGRKLRKHEEGHHKDHNPLNNKPSNIELKEKGQTCIGPSEKVVGRSIARKTFRQG